MTATIHSYHLLEILALGFALSLILGYAAHRLKLSPIVGYLIAGFLLGPHVPGPAADLQLAQELAEAGVILLMFGLGLRFDTKDLLAVKGVAIPGAVVQSAVATLCGIGAGHLFGLPFASSLILGLALAVASTVVLLRMLTDNNMLDTVHGHVAVGWLVVEDLFTIFILILLPSLAIVFGAPEALGPYDLIITFAIAVLRLVLLWVIVMVVGGKLVPWLLTQIVRTRSQELFTLAVLGAAFATAVSAAVFFQASVALGAFLGGMVVGRTQVSFQAGADMLPLRDAFAVLFFISVGMLLDPFFIVEQPGLILLSLAIVLIAKPLVAIIAVAVLGYSVSTSLVVAVSLAQIGEFSFIVAHQAYTLGIIHEMIYNVLVICSIISICLNPFLFRFVPSLTGWLRKHPILWRALNLVADLKARRREAGAWQNSAENGEPAFPWVPVSTAIIVGYGISGQSVAKALFAQQVLPTIIELNVDTVNKLNQGKNTCAIWGDSTRKDVLKAAGVETADYLVITTPNLEQTTLTSSAARNLNPDIRILVRERFLQNKGILLKAGVDAIAFEEEEVARSLAILVMEDLERCGKKTCVTNQLDIA